jgi:hypothetical protein
MHATCRRRPHCKDKSHREDFERREEQPLPDAVNLNVAASTDFARQWRERRRLGDLGDGAASRELVRASVRSLGDGMTS